MIWDVRDSQGNKVPPLQFEGKTQADVVKEIGEAFESYDIVFLVGACGTGKSLIAMTVAQNYSDGAIIVVPTKHLQRQYYNDFKEDGRFRLRGIDIRFILGRNNFICPYTDRRCDDPNLPCTRKLKDDEKRYAVASECPFWSPRYPYKEEMLKRIRDKIGRDYYTYRTAMGEWAVFCSDDPEQDCPFLRQFVAYLEGNVIVMNDKLWLIETLAGRKPIFYAGLEVWDEADHLLQKLVMGQTLSYRRIGKYLEMDTSERLLKMWKKFVRLKEFDDVARDKLWEFLERLEILVSRDTSDEAESLRFKINRIIEEMDDMIIKSVSDPDIRKTKLYFYFRRPAKFIRKILSLSNGKILGMSATLQEPAILREYYGFDNFTIIYGRQKYPGKVYLLPTKRWFITHKNWDKLKEKVQKEAMKVIRWAEKRKFKTLIQVHAFKYIDGMEVPLDDKEHDYLEKFLNGDLLHIASTRTHRGIDLKDEKCRVMVILKHPLPDLESMEIKCLFETMPEDLAWKVYTDMARRSLIQQVGRALRHDDDWVLLAVLDINALNVLKESKCWEIVDVKKKEVEKVADDLVKVRG